MVTMSQKSLCRLPLPLNGSGSWFIFNLGDRFGDQSLGGTANYKVGVWTIYLCNLYIYIYIYILYIKYIYI